ncbi:conserved exported hypothetical protein [Rubrivivax sp. A210]|uniref:hypothetical protein n=1 Tax=Rubrivivax sp. A210 TaxID=2772301 RepID=UPI00191A03C6|nr:hypothetical protein [Rubrivivax sp. A210]CAD5370291.1 conserved exported hypothetical protein [Rubrivivax sp. A210]
MKTPLILMLALAPALAAALEALPQRDPMQPPPSQARAASSDAAAPRPALEAPRQLMSVDGRRYVFDQGRRLGVGDSLGGARIEAIDEGGLWVREAGARVRLPFYGAAVWRPAPGASAPALTPSTPTPRPRRRGDTP